MITLSKFHFYSANESNCYYSLIKLDFHLNRQTDFFTTLGLSLQACPTSTAPPPAAPVNQLQSTCNCTHTLVPA